MRSGAASRPKRDLLVGGSSGLDSSPDAGGEIEAPLGARRWSLRRPFAFAIGSGGGTPRIERSLRTWSVFQCSR